MKTIILKSTLVALFISIFATMAIAQTQVCTIIDVKGSRYADRLWLITNTVSTAYFDNGYDAYKMFGSVVTPQIYVMGLDGNYSVASVNDANNSKIGFRAGEDTQYTLSFTNYDVPSMYSEFILVDEVTGASVNMLQAGATYTFTTSATDPESRFSVHAKFVTTTPVTEPVVTEPVVTEPVVTEPVVTEPVVTEPVVTEPVVTEPVVTEPVVTEPVVTEPVVSEPVVSEPVVSEPVVSEPVVTEPVVTPPVADNNKGKNDKNNKGKNTDNKKKFKVYANGKTITIENGSEFKGHIKVISATTGREKHSFDFNKKCTTKTQTNLSKGVYVIYGRTQSEEFSENVIIQ